MQGWRRIAIVGVLAWVVAAAVWSTRPWTDVVSLKVPKGTPPQSVSYGCGRLFGSAEVKPSVEAVGAAYQLGHKPCSARTERRVLAVVDVSVGAVALFVLLTRFPARRAEVPSAA